MHNNSMVASHHKLLLSHGKLFVHVEVEIGFTVIEDSISESVSQVDACLIVTEGTLERDISVQIRDDSSQGICTWMY